MTDTARGATIVSARGWAAIPLRNVPAVRIKPGTKPAGPPVVEPPVVEPLKRHWR